MRLALRPPFLSPNLNSLSKLDVLGCHMDRRNGLARNLQVTINEADSIGKALLLQGLSLIHI